MNDSYEFTLHAYVPFGTVDDRPLTPWDWLALIRANSPECLASVWSISSLQHGLGRLHDAMLFVEEYRLHAGYCWYPMWSNGERWDRCLFTVCFEDAREAVLFRMAPFEPQPWRQPIWATEAPALKHSVVSVV